MLAHELRHPLAPIHNSVDNLYQLGLDRTELRAACDILQRQVQQMTRLVDDLADVSRSRAGRSELQAEALELAPLLRTLESSMRPAFESSRQVFARNLPAAPIYVHGDSARLLQVFSNVLQNANKYTPTGGRISMDVESIGGEVVVRVRDTGIGIPTEMLGKIFEPFAQLDRSNRRTRGGLGLGLSVTKHQTKQQEDKIVAYSAGEGKGSEFVIRLAECEPPRPS